MPIYEYKCSKCDAEFEKLVFANQLITCPQCQSDDVKKKFSTFAMSGVQKGTGSSCSSCSSGSCSSCK